MLVWSQNQAPCLYVVVVVGVGVWVGIEVAAAAVAVVVVDAVVLVDDLPVLSVTLLKGCLYP